MKKIIKQIIPFILLFVFAFITQALAQEDNFVSTPPNFKVAFVGDTDFSPVIFGMILDEGAKRKGQVKLLSVN